jgi:hypothetical protein
VTEPFADAVTRPPGQEVDLSREQLNLEAATHGLDARNLGGRHGQGPDTATEQRHCLEPLAGLLTAQRYRLATVSMASISSAA